MVRDQLKWLNKQLIISKVKRVSFEKTEQNSEDLHSLIKQMLEKSESARLSITEVMSSVYFTEF